MTTITAPAAGARYRKLSTGRTWCVERISDCGLVVLTEEYYGEDCSLREYVTSGELAAGYAVSA